MYKAIIYIVLIYIVIIYIYSNDIYIVIMYIHSNSIYIIYSNYIYNYKYIHNYILSYISPFTRLRDHENSKLPRGRPLSSNIWWTSGSRNGLQLTPA